MRLVAGVVLVVLGGVTGCERTATDVQLSGWLDEAHSAEAQRRAAPTSTDSDWGLQLRGNVRGGAVDFTASELAAMGTTHVRTTNPNHTSNLAEVIDYRGVPIAQLLDASGAVVGTGPAPENLTLIAADGFLESQTIDEVRKAPIMLARAENGVLLTRNHGGPLLEVFPHTTHPETRVAHPEGGVFYVTCIIVGTEPFALRIAEHHLHASDLASLSEHVVDVKGGFRYRWPSVATKVHGYLLRDVLSSVGVAIHPGDSVVVGRKPHTETSERAKISLRADDILSCDILLGLRYGDDRALLPAILGGPAVIAFPSACLGAAGGKAWSQFVESIDVVPAGKAAP